ncbi:MAG: pectin acetylesterase-family hydrolase [Polyangiaceae bacterium]|jgi:hypothetical protein
MTWQFVPVEGTMCRNGSPTGIALNLNPSSKQLMIYLEGGGACFNSITCGMNPESFPNPTTNPTTCTASDGAACVSFSERLGGAEGSAGIFNRADTANPVADWNFVYVPFCTGDIHAGNKPNGTIAGVTGVQQFVGYANVARDLARIVPTFPGLTKVLLTGISAGGFGAAANYPQVARAFGGVPVYDLDDSGPFMEAPYLASCLQAEQVTNWGLDKTVLADCGSDCPDPSNYTIDATIHTLKMYPNVPFGLVDDTGDSVISLFFGFGNDNCTAAIGELSESTYTMGLLDARAKVSAYKNAGSFIFQGTVHTSLGGSTLDTVTANLDDDAGTDAGTELLSTWVSTLVNSGTVTNVGP